MNKEYEEQSIEREYADVVSRFSGYKKGVWPSEEALRVALSRVPEADERVILGEALRYTGGSRKKDGSFISIISDYFSMQNNWKMIAPVAVVVLLVGVAVVGMRGKNGSEPTSLATNKQASIPVAEDATPPQAVATTQNSAVPTKEGSGDIDDIIAELSMETDVDTAMMADTDGDFALIASDSRVISEYGTSYEESNF